MSSLALTDILRRQRRELEALEEKIAREISRLIFSNRREILEVLVNSTTSQLDFVSPALYTKIEKLYQPLLNAISEGQLSAAALGESHALQWAAPLADDLPRKIFAQLVQAPLGDVPLEIVQAAQERILGDGLKLSHRVWRITDQLEQQIRARLTIGVSQGASIRDVAKDIKDLYDVPRWQAMRLARTETMWAYRQAQVEVARKKDFFSGLRWSVSNADPCELCQELDGRVFLPEEDPPPTHPQCMCTLIPELKPVDEILAAHSFEE